MFESLSEVNATDETRKEAEILLEMILQPKKHANAVVRYEGGYCDLREGGTFKKGELPEDIRVIDGRKGFRHPYDNYVPVKHLLVADSARSGEFKIYLYDLLFGFSDKSLVWNSSKCMHYTGDPKKNQVYDLVYGFPAERDVSAIIANIREYNADVSMNLSAVVGNGYEFSGSLFNYLFPNLLDGSKRVVAKNPVTSGVEMIIPELKERELPCDEFIKKWGPFFKYIHIVFSGKVDKLDYLYQNDLRGFFHDIFDGNIYSEGVDTLCNDEAIYKSLKGLDGRAEEVLIKYPWLQNFKTYILFERIIKAAGIETVIGLAEDIELMKLSTRDENKKEFLARGNKLMQELKRRA